MVIGMLARDECDDTQIMLPCTSNIYSRGFLMKLEITHVCVCAADVARLPYVRYVFIVSLRGTEAA